MRSLARNLLMLGALTVLVVPCATAALPKRPSAAWLHGAESYTNAQRRPVDIRLIVVHVTEGPFWGSISWLKNQRAHASAHYVVARNGRIVQIVRQADVAWHAGNWKVNTQSVGIEHAGVTNSPEGFTRAQYRASARLVAWIARASGIPIDRRHIIGHDEVPDPDDPLATGGADHHQDPGPYWNWALYMKLVHRFANPAAPIHVSSTLRDGRSLAGVAPWGARVRGRGVGRVDFLVDGRLVHRDRRPPFVLRSWNTTHITNGRHLLELRAYADGTRDVWRGAIVIHNRPLALKVSGVDHGGSVAGIVRLQAFVQGAYGRSVSLLVDRRVAARRTRAPYVFAWDSRRVKNGFHTLELVARARDGRVTSREVDVLVGNGEPAQAQIVAQSLGDGQTVTGTVPWQVTIRGPVWRVQFFVDGELRSTRTYLPFRYDWDTTRETPGTHALTVRALRPDGSTAESRLTVVVSR
jgi:N-acetyl-anhydromuramyl-L-alanine amidase AmpD